MSRTNHRHQIERGLLSMLYASKLSNIPYQTMGHLLDTNEIVHYKLPESRVRLVSASALLRYCENNGVIYAREPLTTASENDIKRNGYATSHAVPTHGTVVVSQFDEKQVPQDTPQDEPAP